ncbi:recombination protein 2 [[Haemophilus] ducreyi]|nr:recombination protein 2 [[Haemophilus] ducreyi]
MRSQHQTKHLPTQGLLLALAFGERAWLTAEDWKLFQQISTAHLVAISGLHIGLAFAFGFWCAKLLQWCFLRVGCRLAIAFNYSVVNIIGLIFAFGYSYLAGFAIPTVRALIAIIFVLSCRYCRCYYTAWQLWWRIVAILLVLDPLAILADSFWLSILAVLSLIIWYQYFPLTEFIVQKKNKKLPKFYRLLLSLAHLQLGILCVFAPVQYYFFEGLSAVAFITNLLIVPYYSFLVVPLILISLLTNNFFHTWQLTDQLIQGSLTILNTASTHWFWLS